jgi:hypothetical protein
MSYDPASASLFVKRQTMIGRNRTRADARDRKMIRLETDWSELRIIT